jgi:hypothetical protein
MGESASQIAQELDQKRAEATQKIDQLEQQVAQTAEDIKETVDIRRQVEQRPLISLGAAFMGGIILGGLVGGDSGNQRGGGRGYDSYDGRSHNGSQGQGSSLIDGLRGAAKKTGLEDAINSAAAAMMANAGDRIKSTINQNYPGFSEKYQTASHAQGGVTEKTKAATSTGDAQA